MFSCSSGFSIGTIARMLVDIDVPRGGAVRIVGGLSPARRSSTA